MVLATINAAPASLSQLVKKAAASLGNARSAAEVLEARDLAAVVYDVAKRAARLQRAKAAHDDLIAATHRAQADALEIESLAKRRLASEYDAAQECGEVQKDGRPKTVSDGNGFTPVTAADLGLSRKAIHDARLLRDAEQADPGIVRRTLDERLARGEEPTRAALKRAVADLKSNVRRAAREMALGGEKLPTPAEARAISRDAGGAGVIATDGKYHFHTTPAQDAARGHWQTLRYGILDDLETKTTPAEAVAAVPRHMKAWVGTRAAERHAWLESFLTIWRTNHERS
jgi:hypothetical protein